VIYARSSLSLRVLLGLAATLLFAAQAPADDTDQLTAAYERGLQEYKAERFSQARHSFSQALALAPKVFGPGKRGPMEINTATLHELVGLCELEALDLAQAESRFAGCIRVGELEETFPSPLALRCKNNLAELYQRLHQYDRSEKLFREVLREQPDRREWANSASNLAYLLLMQDRLDEAGRSFFAAQEILAKVPGAEGALKRALITHGLGMIAHKQGRSTEAEKLFRQALADRRQHLPEAHRYVAHSKGMLAASLASQGRDQEAQPLLMEAERAMRAFWGDEHLDVAMELHELGLLSERLGEVERSLARLNESRRILRNYQLQTLRFVPEDVQLRFLAEERGRFQDVMAIARRHKDDPNVVRASLEWALNEKGLAHEALGDRQLVARSASLDPRRRATANELKQVRQELVALAGLGKTAPADKAAAASRREAELLAKLGLPDENLRAAWFTVDQVRNGLDADAALVEIVRLERESPVRSAFDARFKADPGQARYLAWVLRRSGDVRLVELGLAREIDAQIRQVRGAIAADTTPEGRLNKEGETAATGAIDSRLARLSEHILQPLADELRNVKNLVLSPDDALWLTPWAALPLTYAGETKLLVERLALRYEISGRNLLRPVSPSAPLQAPVVFADPNYDLGRSESSAALARVLVDPARRPPVETRSAELLDLSSLPRFRPLAHSATEANAIRPFLQQFAGQAAIVYDGRFALEGVAKAVHQPSVVSFITHGFFLPEGASTTDGTPPGPVANPLLRCGLALAGCNTAVRGDASVDDGILTGLEVIALDLRGTRLAVLSACDTGVGQVNTGEGVAGLRQAFQLAGASAVASTLWEIPDRESALIMEGFFGNLAEGKAPSAALRQAQLERIAKRRDKFGAAHPLFWAAWTITGQ
jgi:CHAT domain-containing protein/Tfp pilus assembly protein PilF